MGLTISIATLIVGFVIGYMGQRSGLCIIGGIRNFYLTRDTYLLKGVLAIIIVAGAGFIVTSLVGGPAQDFPAFSEGISEVGSLYNACKDPLNINNNTNNTNILSYIFLSLLGGLGLGIFSVLAIGCPFRQHVRTSEGDKGSFAYIIGFYLAALVFGFTIKPMITIIFGV
ncbi:MAG: YeeE/YedE thiosulfate transporter family protein [Methanosarcinaceae archaeon]|nr:YeeE/YedE thiosulfate transporter family protein [Methanosarcinaceae archaeon]